MHVYFSSVLFRSGIVRLYPEFNVSGRHFTFIHEILQLSPALSVSLGIFLVHGVTLLIPALDHA